MKRRHIVMVGAVFTATILLAGCAGSSGSDTSSTSTANADPIKVTLVYGVTGPLASFVKDYLKGADAAVQSINDAGGVNGRQIEVTVLDDKGDPTQAVSIVQNIVSSGDLPDAIFPGGTSAETLAMLPLVSSAGIFSTSSAVNPAVNDGAAYPLHFGTSPGAADQLKVLAQEFKDNDITKLAVMVANNATGDALVSGITDVAKSAGVEVVDVERPDPAQLNFNVEWERIKNSGAEAMFYDFSQYDAAARALDSRTTVGAADIPIYAGFSAAGAPLSTLVTSPSSLENCFLPAYTFTVQSGDMRKDLQPLYDAYQGEAGGLYIAGFGWDTIHVIASAFEQADGDDSAEALAATLLANGVPADTLTLEGGGTSWGETDRFTQLSDGDLTLVPCSSSQVDGGLWVTQ